MASSKTRAELEATIAELRRNQVESSVNATFLGWTPEKLAEHRKRYDQIADLCSQLEALDGKKPLV